MPNGIRVASESTPGHFGAVGVYVDAGSRYETDKYRGVSHILDRLAFKVKYFYFSLNRVYMGVYTYIEKKKKEKKRIYLVHNNNNNNNRVQPTEVQIKL